MNALLVAVINGFREFKKYVTVNIAGSFIGVLFTISLSVPFGVYGALVALVTYQSVIFLVTLSLVTRSPWFKWKVFFGGFSKTIAIKLGHFSLMALASAILMPTGQLFIRNFITVHESLGSAGLWEGLNRISTMYLMVITTSFSVYYLPRLSGLKTDREIRNEVFWVYKFLVPFLSVTLFLIYLFRNLIIHILFNNRFIGMGDLFAYQLAGDFFKMATWVLGYLFLVKTMTRFYILMELAGSSLYVLLSFFFIKQYGTIGASMGFCLAYFIIFIVHVFIFRKLLFGNERS
jgi:PST family polysaccharide transporter